jgi:hypothetical protein
MDAAKYSEMFVPPYQTTRRHIAEDLNPNIHGQENTTSRAIM